MDGEEVESPQHGDRHGEKAVSERHELILDRVSMKNKRNIVHLLCSLT